VSGVVIRPGRVTAITAADPVDAVDIADRLGRYAEGAELDGVPLGDLRLAAVRERILVADNDARLFSGSLRADLDPAPRGRLPDALAAASATDIIDGLPNGLDSHVAERGRSFSGGQQQRLRLVRALVADPEILVLVEPTSAVDAHTEARIAARLGTARAGRTTVVCSTSPLVLDHADHVVYVEHGRAVAEGTHRELLSSEPGYARAVLREEDA
jgi:ABC-type multidrug transport system fused ATPase/permease subunit